VGFTPMPDFELPRLIWLVIPAAAAQFVLREALLERAKLKPGVAIFPTIISFRVLSVAGPLMFLYGSYQIARAAQTRFDSFLTSIMIGFAVLTFCSEQGTILISDEGIFFRRWYGLRKCTIPWKDVRSAVSSKVLKTITVFAADGRSIVHTQWHVAPSTLEALLALRLKDNFIQR
jgi:hypothetical protein